MHQEELFHESWEVALQDTVRRLGGFKKVAATLWPAMKLDSAYSKLKSCLDEDKEREKLSLSEIETLTKMGQKAGFHYGAIYFNTATGYKEPVPMNPVEQEAELGKKVLAMGAELQKALSQLEKIQSLKG